MYVAKIIEEVSYARLHLQEVFVQRTSQRLMYCICIYFADSGEHNLALSQQP